jgi:fructoselysine 6-kinase
MLKVIGIGDNVVDKYLHINTMYPGGNALNFSVYAKQLKEEAAYLGVFGNDAAATHIINVLTNIGIDLSRCRHYDGENGYAMVNIVDGDRVFAGSNKGGIAKKKSIRLDNLDLEYIKRFELVHTSCYSYMENEIVKIKKLGMPVSFDFSHKWNEDYLKEVCPNVDFSFLSCGHIQDTEIKELLKKISGYGCRLAVSTMGSRGAMLYDGQKFYYQQSELIKAIDTMGAGDSFITAFLLGYLEGKKGFAVSDNSESYEYEEALIKACLSQASLFAAQTCMIEGAFGYGLKYI